MSAHSRLFYIAAAFIFASGCGIDFKVGNGTIQPAPGKFELETGAADTAIRFGSDIDQLIQFSRGVDGLVPDFDELFAGAGLGGSGSAMAPALAPASLDDTCPAEGSGDPLPGDNICTISETKINPEPGVESQIETVGIYFPDGATTEEKDFVGVFYGATKKYSDDSTGVVLVIDLEAPTGTSSSNLNRHDIEYSELRTYEAGNDIAYEYGRVGINFHGLPDDSAAAKRTLVGDQLDEAFYAVFSQTFDDGSLSEVQVWPSEPLQAGADPAAGTVTYSVTYVDGALRQSVETVTWDAEEESLSGSKTLTYADGSEETEVYSIADGKVSLIRTGRRGESESWAIDLTTGVYDKMTTFADGHPIASIEESGSIVDSGGRITVTLTQVTVYATGDQEILDATVVANSTSRVDIEYEKVLVDGGIETGSITIVDGIASDSLEADIVLPDGLLVHAEAVLFRDGSAQLSLSVDDPETEQNPDWTAELKLYPDGSAEGTITVDGVTEPFQSDS